MPKFIVEYERTLAGRIEIDANSEDEITESEIYGLADSEQETRFIIQTVTPLDDWADPDNAE